MLQSCEKGILTHLMKGCQFNIFYYKIRTKKILKNASTVRGHQGTPSMFVDRGNPPTTYFTAWSHRMQSLNKHILFIKQI